MDDTQFPFNPEKSNYLEVVLTGGPSAGKTSAIPSIIQYYSERNIRVLTAPELATIIMTGGLSDFPRIRETNNNHYNVLQTEMILMQNVLRKRYQAIARSFAPDQVVIVYDRAECDFQAYMDSDIFWKTIKDNQLTVNDVRNSYDLVIHMVTAADGAVEHYSCDNNPARLETPEQAIAADRRTRKAWLGHPRLRIVDNSTPFKSKLERLLQHIDSALGVDGEHLEYERRFLLSEPPDLNSALLNQAKEIFIEQTYLLTDSADQEVRVRKWADSDELVTYFWTRKRDLQSGGREEREELISESQYKHLLTQADPSRKPIYKTRYCFFDSGRHCQLDQIKLENRHLWVLEVYLNSYQEKFTPPKQLNISKEITNLPEFSNKTLADVDNT
jgi:CYTH domain-containing protein